jgi:outer membrane protein assembly factor BamB
MNPQTTLSLQKSILFYGLLAMIFVSCQRTNVMPPPAPHVTPSDTTTITRTTTPATPLDTVMTIYVGRGTSLWAVNAQTGAIKWSTPLGDLVDQSPLYYQGMIYIATGFQTTYKLHAVDTNGKEQWSVILNAQVDVAPNQVYALNGVIYTSAQMAPPVAVDAKTGATRWAFPAASPGPYTTYSSGNMILNDTSLYFINFPAVFLVSASSGQIIWEIDYQTTQLPGVTAGKVILGEASAAVEAFDGKTTAFLWQTPAPPSWPDVVIQSINVAMGNAYVYEGGTVNVLDTATGATKLAITIGGPGGGGTAHCTDSNLFVSTANNLFCANVVTGAQKWDLGLSPGYGIYDAVLSGASSLNNVVYFNYDLLYAMNVTTQQFIWKTQLETNDGWSYSTPCLVTKSGKVYRGGNNF